MEEKGDFRPSFNTLGRRAFTFHLRPHLNIIERRELQAFWASLPPFNPLQPNHNPALPCKPAAPRQVGPTLWDWSDMLQPARWFICPCALAGHACAFTGAAPVNCRGWHNVCTEQVSQVLLYYFGKVAYSFVDLQSRSGNEDHPHRQCVRPCFRWQAMWSRAKL